MHIMADVNHQKIEGPAVSNRMRYVSKPIAVRSDNLVASVNESNGSLLSGDGFFHVIFEFHSIFSYRVLLEQQKH